MLQQILKFFLILASLRGAFPQGSGDYEVIELEAKLSKDIQFICTINTAECGDVHSVKFYYENERVYVYSPLANFKNPEGSFIDRSESVGTDEAVELTVSSLQLTDAGEYRCEIAFLDAATDCPAVHIYQLQILAVPKAVELVADGESMLLTSEPESGHTSSATGTYPVSSDLELVCTVDQARPPPSIVWIMGHPGQEGAQIPAERTEELEEEDGTFTTNSFIKITTIEEHAGQEIKCGISHETLEEEIHLSLSLDILVPPEELELVVDGEADLVAGEESSLTCTASHSKPPPVITWTADFSIEQPSTQVNTEEDGNEVAVSTLVIVPTSDDNGASIACIAEHPLLEEPLQSEMTLNVLYVPIVGIEEENMTLTEGDELSITCNVDANPGEENLTITWLFEGELMEDIDLESGGVLTLPAVTRNESGQYTCQAENPIGAAQSLPITLDVLYAPSVSLQILATTQYLPEAGDWDNATVVVFEEDLVNVSLICSAMDGNPLELDTVTWFKDGAVLEEADCTHGICELELAVITRVMDGEYSCMAANIAGVGEASDAQLLTVFYMASPGLVETEDLAVKDGNMTLQCNLEDVGKPPSQQFQWMRNDVVIEEESSSILYLPELSADSIGNYTCSGVNLAGNGPHGEPFLLEVNAPPMFLETPEERLTLAEESGSVTLTCRVECYPLCDIIWLRNGNSILGDDSADNDTAENDFVEGSGLQPQLEDYEVDHSLEAEVDAVAEDIIPEYSELEVGLAPAFEPQDNESFIEESLFSEDSGYYSIEAVDLSSLFRIEVTDWLVSAILEDQPEIPWVSSQLTIDFSNVSQSELEDLNESNFTCLGLANEFGDEISSTSELFIQYGARETSYTGGSSLLTVLEGQHMDKVVCTALGYPPPSITWSRRVSENSLELVSEGPVLYTGQPVSRDESGEYVCESSNSLGQDSATLSIDVQYAPQCSMKMELLEEEILLTCTADGNPKEITFIWGRDNMTFEGQSNEVDSSSVRLQVMNESLGLYFCEATNEIGSSEPCYLEVDGLALFQEDNQLDLTIIIIVIIVIVVVIIILLILIYWCCKKRKSPKEKEIEKAVKPSGKPGKQAKPAKPTKSPKPDRSFYEDLPFNSLKSPPKQVLNPRDDNMVYADVDSSDIYSYGPMGYKSASIQKANQKKQKLVTESKL